MKVEVPVKTTDYKGFNLFGEGSAERCESGEGAANNGALTCPKCHGRMERATLDYGPWARCADCGAHKHLVWLRERRCSATPSGGQSS